MTGLDKGGQTGDNAGAETDANRQAPDTQGDPMREILEHHLIETFALPHSAVAWLVGVWDAFQFFDDIADGDPTERDDLNRVLHGVLVAMPANPFFAANSTSLLPVLATQIIKWQASDAVEREGQADARSYMWRAGYYDIIALVVQLCHGHEIAVKAAPTVMRLYGETLAEYEKEFENA